MSNKTVAKTDVLSALIPSEGKWFSVTEGRAMVQKHHKFGEVTARFAFKKLHSITGKVRGKEVNCIDCKRVGFKLMFKVHADSTRILEESNVITKEKERLRRSPNGPGKTINKTNRAIIAHENKTSWRAGCITGVPGETVLMLGV